MTLTHRFTQNPLSLFQNFDRIFDQALQQLDRPSERPVDGVYDYESEDAYVLRLELPGFSKEEVKLSLEDHELKVEADAGEDESAFRSSYSEVFSYPDDIQVDAITAKLENGILELTLPKKEEAKPVVTAIEIQ